MIKKPKEQEQVEKIKVINPEIIVTMMGARPYYEIKYFDISDCKWHIGYSSYDLKNVIEWKNECFEVIDTNDGWIPCSERLPKENVNSIYYDTVIITLSDGRTITGCYRNHDKEWWGDVKDGEYRNITGEVIAWQPLPEPYKGE